MAMNIGNPDARLPYLDSVHDFWKERKRAAAGLPETQKARPDEEDSTENFLLDEKKLDYVRDHLLNTLSVKLRGAPAAGRDDIRNILGGLTNNGVGSATSNFERNVESWFENNFEELHASSKESITYDDIIQNYAESNAQVDIEGGAIRGTNLPTLVQKYNQNRYENHILRISIGNSGFLNVKNDGSKIANFILNYFLGHRAPVGGDVGGVPFNVGLTTDAKIGLPHKLCRNITQVYNLVTPANIADSATTSFKALSTRNVYSFPRTAANFPDENAFQQRDPDALFAEPGKYIFKSNYFTKDNGVRLKFSQYPGRNFSKTDQYAFNLEVATPVKDTTGQLAPAAIGPYTGPQLTFPFGDTQKQGPSVNYLIDLITSPNAGAAAKVTPSVNTILRINDLLGLPIPTQQGDDTVVNSGLLYDIKRGGDYEQINIIPDIEQPDFPVIFTTIDILAALWARLNKRDTILHFNNTITLFRFSQGGISEAATKILAFKNRAEKTVDIFVQLRKFGFQADTITQFTNAQIKPYLINGICANKSAIQALKKGSYTLQRLNDNMLYLVASNSVPITPRSPVNASKIVNIIIKIRLLDMLLGLKNMGILITQTIQPLLEKEASDAFIVSLKNVLATIPSADSVVQMSPDQQNQFAARFVEDSKRAENVINTYNGVINDIRKIGIDLSYYKFDSADGAIAALQDPAARVAALEREYLANFPFLSTQLEGQPAEAMFLNKAGDNLMFKFSHKVYFNLLDALNGLSAKMNLNRPSSRPKKYYEQLAKGFRYFTSVNEIYTSFFNNELGEIVNNLLMPPSSEDAQVEEWYLGLADKCNFLFLQQLQLFQENTIPGLRGGATMDDSYLNGDWKPIGPHGAQPSYYENNLNKILFKQTGGTVQPENQGVILPQYEERSDLLRHIAGIAAQFIEGFRAVHPPRPSGPTNDTLNTLIILLRQSRVMRSASGTSPGEEVQSNFLTCKNTMAQIRRVLFDGVLELQEQSNYEPSTIEYILMYMMSYTYNDTTGFNEPPYRNQLPNPNGDFFNIEILLDNVMFQIENLNLTNERIGRDIQNIKKGNRVVAELEQFYNNPNPCPVGYEAKAGGASTQVPAEITNLIFLTLIDNTMQNSPENRQFLQFTELDGAARATKFAYNSFGGDPRDTMPVQRKKWENLLEYISIYLGRICRGNWPNNTAFALVGGSKTRRKRNKKIKKTIRKRNKKFKKTRIFKKKRKAKKTKRLLI